MKKKTLVLVTLLLLSGCAATNQHHDESSRLDVSGVGAIKPANTAEIRMLLSQSQISGNTDAMIYAYTQALAYDEFDKADIYLQIAHLEQQRNNNNRAEQAYRQALAVKPEWQETKQSLALLLLGMKRHDEADTLLQEVLAADRSRLNTTSAEPGEPGEPGESGECVTDHESPWRSYNGLGLLADIREQGELARQYYQCALKIQPGLAMLYTNLGFSYYLEGEYAQADRALTRAVNQDPEYQRAWSNLGLLYYRWGRKSDALRVLGNNGTQAEALNDLGYIALMEGEYEEAASLFQRAIDASPRYYPRAVANLNQVKAMMTANQR